MTPVQIKRKILDHLGSLNELERKQGMGALIETLCERYDVSRPTVEKIIAEWSAGRKKE